MQRAMCVRVRRYPFYATYMPAALVHMLLETDDSGELESQRQPLQLACSWVPEFQATAFCQLLRRLLKSRERRPFPPGLADVAAEGPADLETEPRATQALIQ